MAHRVGIAFLTISGIPSANMAVKIRIVREHRAAVTTDWTAAVDDALGAGDTGFITIHADDHDHQHLEAGAGGVVAVLGVGYSDRS